ncbi:hypothetical protein, partial [Mycolicibacterium arseniciresistens]
VAGAAGDGGKNSTGVRDDDELVDAVLVSDPHAVRPIMTDAAHAASATDEDRRGEFTIRHATADAAVVGRRPGPLQPDMRASMPAS